MRKQVLILGCGPAGLMAAQAAVTSDAEVRIISRKEKSVIGGAQYLHCSIPLVTGLDPDEFITVRKVGTREGYAQKIYDDPNRTTSWDNYENGESVFAWDLRKTYDKLWNMHEDKIVGLTVNAAWVKTALTVYDLVVSTIPAPALCARPEDHVFKKQKVLIDMDHMPPEDNVILWNGMEEDPWYRCSRVFGVTGGYEYPVGSIVPNAHVARKPLMTTCDCFPEVLRAGRYGAWDKSLLTHHAYNVVMERMTGKLLEDMQRRVR